MAKTLIVGHPRHHHERGTNLVFCATFQLAWNELMGQMGGAVELDGEPPLATQLNRSELTRSDLDEASYLARAELGNDGLSSIRRELSDKFPGQPADLLPEHVPSDAIVAFAHLSKNIAYQVPFAHEKLGVLFDNSYVEAFGVWNADSLDLLEPRANQVVVHDCQGRDDFVVELLTLLPEERILVAKVPPRATLLQTVQGAIARVDGAAPSSPLSSQETLYIPCVDIEALRSFDDLTGKRVTAGPLQGSSLSVAKQSIRVTLDEHGAVVQSQAVAAAMSIPPRSFTCDKPFLVVMMRREASFPYLAVWVENCEVLRNSG